MRKIIKALVLSTLILILSLLSAACGTPRGQILFVIDSSGSMTASAGYPEDPQATRWEIVQRLAPEWLSRIPGDSFVGAVSVGGNCGGRPALNLTAGADRSQIAAAIRSEVPGGGTPLNEVLKATPALFAANVPGDKKIVLFSDGMDTCSSGETTCEIVRELNRNHGIVVDVVAWVTEPSMVNEFKCVAASSGGAFTEPNSFRDLFKLPFLAFDPWRYVVLVLGLMTLMLSLLVMYRHGYYAMRWSSGTASTVATVITGAGALALYLVLFVGTGWIASLLGIILIVAAVAVARLRSNRAARSFSAAASLVIIWLAACPLTASGQSGQCSQAVQGTARYHHILALDMSGTVTGSFNEMKALVACYAGMYALPGEEISLVAFGIDAQGSAREIATFTVPRNRSTDILNRTLDDLEIQNPAKTRTYFKPLADYFNQRLKSVRLEPVMLVVSDGKSDGFEDVRLGRMSFREIPFESFGKRGIYAAPGVTGWRVAVQGGAGLDLTALFKQRISTNQRDTRLSAPIEECLVDPDLLFETSDTVTLKPGLNPFSKSVEGTLAMTVRNECVSRFRSFRVELRRGAETQVIGTISNMSINPEPSDLSFNFRQDASGIELSEAVVQLVLDQGDTERTIYATRPSRVVLKEVSYISDYGPYWVGALAIAVVLGLLFVVGAGRRRVRERNRPQLIGVMGGNSIALRPNQRVEIGGPGSTLQVPGVGEGIILGSIESSATRKTLIIQVADRFKMKVNGFESMGSSDYTLGTPLQFINIQDKTTYDVTLHSDSVSGTFTSTGHDGGSFTGFQSFQDFGRGDPLGAGGSDPYI